MRTLRLFAFLFSKPVGRRQFEEIPIIGIKMLKTLLKMLKNQHNFEYFCFGYSASVLCGVVSATMGLHGSVWRFTTVWVRVLTCGYRGSVRCTVRVPCGLRRRLNGVY